jgi:hypothetical protein
MGITMAKKGTQVDSLAVFMEPKKSNFPALTPEEGARLVRAFLGIRDSAVRSAIVSLVEQMSKALSDAPLPRL